MSAQDNIALPGIKDDEMEAGSDFVDRMRKLDEAEQLLASCSVRGVIRDHRSHMAVNRKILDAARHQLEEVEAALMPMAECGAA